MRTYEEIGKAISQGYLYINDKKYSIEKAVPIANDCLAFFLKKEGDNTKIGINALRDEWDLEPKMDLSEIDKAIIKLLSEFGYTYLRTDGIDVDVSEDVFFVGRERLAPGNFSNLKRGIYKFKDGGELKYLGDCYE